MRITIILIFVTISHLGLSQSLNKKFNAQINDIILNIRKNLPLKESDILTKKSEYFIFDLTLDDEGRLKDIEILRRDSSYNINSIRSILPIIKNSWTPIKSKYHKVFIPLIFTFENEDSEGNMIDENGTFEVEYFFKFLKNKNNIVFVSKRISIHFFEPRR